MVTFRELPSALSGAFADWVRLRLSDMQFPEGRTALLVVGVLVAVSLLVMAARGLWTRKGGRTHVVLPAIVPVFGRSYFSATRHAAFVLFLCGLPFFAIALADPRTTF